MMAVALQHTMHIMSHLTTSSQSPISILPPPIQTQMTSVPGTCITLFTTPVRGKPYSNPKILKYFGLIRIQ
jgi:hypothetical protein